PDWKIGRDDTGAQTLDEGEALGREMRRERGGGLDGYRAAARQGLCAEGRFGMREGHGKPAQRSKARGRDGRGISIPGNLQRRWAPCGQAHGQGQGQLPWRSISPGNTNPTRTPQLRLNNVRGDEAK